MRHALIALVRNLAAGARLAAFLRVDRAAFRIDVAQWLLTVLVSALLDIALDGLRVAPGASWSPLGVNGELFALGLLMLTSALVAALCRDASIFMALPLVVLAAFPLLQIVHALPAIAHLELAPDAATTFELLLFGWSVVVCMRAVRAVNETPVQGRTWRAVAGGLLLSLPLWFAPLAGPFEGWWTDGSDPMTGDTTSGATGSAAGGAAGGATSPASEPVMAVQGYLLDQAVDNLEDERAGVTDLYFVGFAPDSRRDGFRQELDLAQRVLDQRFDTQGRSLTLLNHPDTVTEVPFATLTNLRRVLLDIGDTIDPDNDIVMLYLTGAPDADNGLAAVHPPLELVPLTPEGLKQLLDAAGIRFRVIVVSTCAAGPWVDALQDADTAILVSSPAQARAPRCEGAAEPSTFSTALFGRALRTADSIAAAFAEVVRDLAQQGASAPQLWMGPAVEAELKRIRGGPPLRTAALRARRSP